MKQTHHWIFLLLVWVWITGCTPADWAKPTPVPLTQDAEQMAHANNMFGFDLLAALKQDGLDENLFFSPLSLALALQMVYNGASAEIADDVAAVLQLPPLSTEEINEANRVLQGNLRGIEEVDLLIANSIWLRQGVGLLETYAERMRTGYDAEVVEVDFDDPATLEQVNAWVEEQTRGEITEIVQAFPPDLILYLINAIYFKGDWQEQFDPNLTREEIFTLADGTEKMFPLMRQTNSFPFYQGPNFQLAALPYGDEGRIQMVVLLPDEEVPLERLLDELDLPTWQQWVSQLQPQRLEIMLPRFGAEYANDEMLETLAALGLPIGSYTEMTELELFIGQVTHKAIVKVNEEGTVAAAVTGVAMPTSMPPSFIVNRPFFLTIQDSKSGAIFFMGAIVDPELLDE